MLHIYAYTMRLSERRNRRGQMNRAARCELCNVHKVMRALIRGSRLAGSSRRLVYNVQVYIQVYMNMFVYQCFYMIQYID